MVPIRRDATILTVTESGRGKRTPVGEFPLQKRGGLGTMVVSSSDDSGDVVCALEVLEGDEVMVVAESGRVRRIPAPEIAVRGRRRVARVLVDLGEGDRVVWKSHGHTGVTVGRERRGCGSGREPRPPPGRRLGPAKKPSSS